MSDDRDEGTAFLILSSPLKGKIALDFFGIITFAQLLVLTAGSFCTPKENGPHLRAS